MIEPVAFAEPQLAALCKHGRRDANRESLAQLLEYCTGIPPNKVLFDTNRTESTMEHFEKELYELNVQMGRRARDLVLPPNWMLCGHYDLTEEADKVFLSHRRSGARVELDLQQLDAESIEDLTISENFSEARASVGLKGGSLFESVPCAELLGNQAEAIRPPPKQKMLVAPPQPQPMPSKGKGFKRVLALEDDKKDRDVAQLAIADGAGAPGLTPSGSATTSASPPSSRKARCLERPVLPSPHNATQPLRQDKVGEMSFCPDVDMSEL